MGVRSPRLLFGRRRVVGLDAEEEPVARRGAKRGVEDRMVAREAVRAKCEDVNAAPRTVHSNVMGMNAGQLLTRWPPTLTGSRSPTSSSRARAGAADDAAQRLLGKRLCGRAASQPRPGTGVWRPCDGSRFVRCAWRGRLLEIAESHHRGWADASYRDRLLLELRFGQHARISKIARQEGMRGRTG